MREEYGIDSQTLEWTDFQVVYEPSDYGICTNYTDVEKLYEVQLAPTVITKVENAETNEIQIKKQLKKAKMMGNEL